VGTNSPSYVWSRQADTASRYSSGRASTTSWVIVCGTGGKTAITDVAPLGRTRTSVFAPASATMRSPPSTATAYGFENTSPSYRSGDRPSSAPISTHESRVPSAHP
jgi:hypothetical protein